MQYEITPMTPNDPAGECFLEFAAEKRGDPNVLRGPLHFDTRRDAKRAARALINQDAWLRGHRPSLYAWFDLFRNRDRVLADAIRSGLVPPELQTDL